PASGTARSTGTTPTAAGSAAATPAPPESGQVGLYENESIRRTPVAGTGSGGAGTTASPANTPWSLSRVPAALAAVLILIVGIRWIVKKMSGASGANRSTRAMR